MMLINKSDVRAHFAVRIGKSLLHKNPAIQPAADSSSGVEIGKLGLRLVIPGEDLGKLPSSIAQGIPPTV